MLWSPQLWWDGAAVDAADVDADYDAGVTVVDDDTNVVDPDVADCWGCIIVANEIDVGDDHVFSVTDHSDQLFNVDVIGEKLLLLLLLILMLLLLLIIMLLQKLKMLLLMLLVMQMLLIPPWQCSCY